MELMRYVSFWSFDVGVWVIDFCRLKYGNEDILVFWFLSGKLVRKVGFMY